MLSSMPIKKSEIIISKILTMYLIETIYSAILMIPNGVILSIYTSNILYLLSSLVLTILIPALPIVIGTLFGLIVTLFFEKYKYFLNKGGVIITDNLKFHGYVGKSKTIESKNLRQLVSKIESYIDFLKNNDEFETEFLNLLEFLFHHKKDSTHL